jgi:hypothetical protein
MKLENEQIKRTMSIQQDVLEQFCSNISVASEDVGHPIKVAGGDNN